MRTDSATPCARPWRFTPLAGMAIVLVLMVGPVRGVRAAVATFDLHLDTDRNAATGCSILSADGTIQGVELRLRTTVDTTTDEVTSITHASCSVGSFGADTPVSGPALPPWSIATGEGTTGSTLIETTLPLALIAGVPIADAYATVSSIGLEDALTALDGNAPGGGFPLLLDPAQAPALGRMGLAMLAVMLLAGACFFPPSMKRTQALVVLLAASGLTAPLAVRAALGDGTLRNWLPWEEVATDPQGDTPEGADILRLFTALDVEQNTLIVRIDVLFGPPVCLDWGIVDPGAGYPCMQEPPPDQGPFGNHVALTFDDGPSLSTTHQILTILRNENVPATFFMLGEKLHTGAEQAIALDIHNDPLFRLANHTYDHTDLTTVSQAEIAVQLETTAALLRDAVGDDCLFTRYFRFPRGRSNCDSMETVRELGYGVAGVNIDPVDWCYAAGGGYCATAPWVPVEYRDDLPGYAVQRLISKGGGIMLMHDIHQNTVDNLQAIITAYKALGVVFVHLDELVYFPILNANVNPPEPPACCDGVVN